MTADSMLVEIYNASELSSPHRREWEKLFTSVPDARFYHHPHWLMCVARSLSPGELRCAFLRGNKLCENETGEKQSNQESELLMVVPLCDAKGKHRHCHPAHSHLSLNDLLIHPELANSSDRLLNALEFVLDFAGERWWDWQISNVPQTSQLIKALSQESGELQNLSSDDNEPESNTKSYLDLRIEQTLQSQPWLIKQTRQSASFDCSSDNCPPHGKLRRNLRRLRKQLEDQAQIRIECVTNPAKLSAAFEHFLDTEASGWKGQGEGATAIASNEDLVKFYASLLDISLVEDLPEQSAGSLQPQINLLWCGDNCAAAQFALRTGDCLSLLKIGYNEAFARYSPGYLLLETILAEAPERGISTVSLVTSPPWSDRWHPDLTPVWHINRYNNNTLGSFLHQLDKLKQVAKTRLGQAA